MTTNIEIGDQVRAMKPIMMGKTVYVPKGSIGQVSDSLGKAKKGPKFVVEFEGLPFHFWHDELQLVKKGKPGERMKPPPEPTMHRQRAINLGGKSVQVDVKLAPLIKGLFRAGIMTCMSCQENQQGITWLMFINTEHALRFVSRASKAMKFFYWNNDAGILIDSNDDFGPVSIRFPYADLKGVTKLFAVK